MPLLHQRGDLEMKNSPLALISKHFDLEIKTRTKASTIATTKHSSTNTLAERICILSEHLKISHLSKKVLTLLRPYEPNWNSRGEISTLYRYTILTL